MNIHVATAAKRSAVSLKAGSHISPPPAVTPIKQRLNPTAYLEIAASDVRAACRTLSVRECQLLYEGAIGAADAFAAQANLPAASKGAGVNFIDALTETMDELVELIVDQVEKKPVKSEQDGEAKFAVLVDYWGRRCGDYLKATETAAALMTKIVVKDQKAWATRVAGHAVRTVRAVRAARGPVGVLEKGQITFDREPAAGV
jgi:hypothetical protein